MVEVRRSSVSSPVRVLVIDDHGMFGRGLELLLRAASDGRIEVVGSTSDPLAAEELVTEHQPDVVIVDLSMPTRQGEDVIAGINSSAPEVRTLVVSGTDDLERVKSALLQGADGFVPKTSDPAELLGPILSIAAGWSVLPGFVLSDMAGPPRNRVKLSDRELWLIRRLAAGAETKQLADELNVSDRTAKRQVASMLDNLGVDSRIEAVALAGRVGLLEAIAIPYRPPAD